MARYISAEKAKEILLKNFPECRNCAEEIDCVPTEDVEPVVHAHWDWDMSDRYYCSNCGAKTSVDEIMGRPAYGWCPYCGSRMEE